MVMSHVVIGPRSKNNELVSSAADRGIHLVTMIMMDVRRKRGDDNIVLRRKIQQRRMRRRRGRRKSQRRVEVGTKIGGGKQNDFHAKR